MLKHALNYLSVSFFSGLLGFVAIPFYTNLLTPGEYGIYNYFLAILAISNIVLTMNFHTSIGRYWYENVNDTSDFIGISTIGMLAIVATIGFFLYFNPVFIESIGINGELVKYVFLLVVLNAIFEVYYQILIPRRKSKRFAIFNIAKMYLVFAVSVVFIYTLNVEKYLSLIYAQISVSVILAVYILYDISSFISFNFRKAHFKYIVSYGGPLLFYSLSAIALSQIDKIMISKIISHEATGIYSLAFQIGSFFSMAVSAVLTAWTPNFFEDMENNRLVSVEKGNDIIISFAFLVAVFVILFGQYIVVYLSGESFISSMTFIPYLVLSMFLTFVYQLYGRSIGYSKKTIYITLIFVVSGLVNIVLNYVLIPVNGIYGAIFATIISSIILLLGGYLVNKFVLKYDDFIIQRSLKCLSMIVLILLATSFLNIEKIVFNLALFSMVLGYLFVKYNAEIKTIINKI
jgi:O-antigen/teichoic acid export membrane protein